MSKFFQTNKIIANFNLEEIENDFVILRFKTSEKYIPYGASALDKIADTKARAVAFDGGKTFYALYKRKDFNLNTISNAFSNLDDFKALSFETISINNIDRHVLLQLLLNSLNNPNSEGLAFNNLTGKLFITDPSLFVRKKQGYIAQIPTLEIKIDSNMNLLFKVATFTSLREKQYLRFEKKKLHEYPKYDFTINNALRRVSGNDGFIKKQFSNKKTNITFLDFKNFDSFKISKCGLLYELYRVIENRLSKYVVLQNEKIEDFVEITTLDYSPKFNKQQVLARIDSKGINIVNKAHGDYVSDFIADLIKAFTEALITNVDVGGETIEDKHNLVVVNSKEFYEQYGLEDPHTASAKIQHLTYEDFSCDSKAAIKCVIKEIAIKDDMLDSRIKMFDWESLCLDTSFVFTCKEENIYCFLTITSSGNMELLVTENVLDGTFADKIAKVASLYAKHKSLLEGVVFAGNEVYALVNTQQKAMPNFMSIGDFLHKEKLPLVIAKNDLMGYLEAIADALQSKKELQMLNDILDAIREGNTIEYDRTSILAIVQSTKCRKMLVELIFGDTGIVLKNYLRQASYRELLFESNLHIKSFERGYRHYYFVGEIGDNIQTGFACASNIREIEVVKGDSKNLNIITRLLNVDFVRNEQLTVLPFPFKYLREYIK